MKLFAVQEGLGPQVATAPFEALFLVFTVVIHAPLNSYKGGLYKNRCTIYTRSKLIKNPKFALELFSDNHISYG